MAEEFGADIPKQSDSEVISPGGDAQSAPETNSDPPEFQAAAGTRDPAQPLSLPNSAPVDFRYKGVKGWLMFFVITLILIRPLFLCASLGQYEQDWGPHYGTYPFLKVVRVINLIVGLGAACFSIYAGFGLLRIRPNAVQMAKGYLVVSAIALILVEPLMLLSGFPEHVNTVILQALPVDTIKVLLYPTVWYLYLSQSKRVATTYAATG